ncbi:MAG: O-antigen ligase family protein [Sarcina sp.]
MKYKRAISIEIIGIIFILTSITPAFSFLFKDSTGCLISFILFFIVVCFKKKGKLNFFKIIKKEFGIIFFSFCIINILLIEIFFQRGVGQMSIVILIIRLLMLSIFNTIMNEYFMREYNNIKKISFFIMLIILTNGILYALENENIVKLVTGKIAISGNEAYEIASLNGVGGSIYYMGIACSIPAVVSRYLNSEYICNKVIDLMFIIIAILSVMISTSLSSIGIMCGGLILYLVLNINVKERKNTMKTMGILFIISIFMVYGTSVLKQNVYFESMINRVENVITSLSDDEISDESYDERNNLNAISINTFNEYPIIGIGTMIGANEVRIREGLGNGGHASIYDLLGMYGIVGGILWCGLFYSLIRKMKDNKDISKSYKLGKNISVGLILLAAFINPVLTNISFWNLICFFIIYLNEESKKRSGF